MSKYYSEDPEYTQMSFSEKTIRDKLEKILSEFTREMEGYSYFSSNPGISEDDYEDVAEKIMDVFNMWDDQKPKPYTGTGSDYLDCVLGVGGFESFGPLDENK
jgi:hypothetical protein